MTGAAAIRLIALGLRELAMDRTVGNGHIADITPTKTK